MFGLGTTEIVIILTIVILMAVGNNFSKIWDSFKNGGGGPFDGGDRFEFQPINSNGSQLSRCHNCGAQTKDSYENCPVCGDKTGEILAITKKYSTV
jgi:hypothetical protein